MKTKIAILAILILSMLSGTVLADTGYVSVSLVNQDPDPAITGNLVELRLGVENDGAQTAENLVFELEAEYPFELVPGSDGIIDVGTLNPYQTDEDMKIVKTRLNTDKDAIAGSYDIDILIYEEGNEAKTSRVKTVTVDIKNKDLVEISGISESTLLPGQETDVVFTIENVGSAPLRDVTFSWSADDDAILPVGSSNSKSIAYLDVGERVDLSYSVIADTTVSAGLYKIDMSLVYDDPISGDATTISTTAGMYIGGGTDFDVAYSDSTEGETSFSISNIGSNPAYSVSIIVPEQDSWEVTGPNTVIIGNLEQGDYTIATFSLASLVKNVESQPIDIDVVYTDTAGNRLSETKSLDLLVSEIGVSMDANGGVVSDDVQRNPGARNPMRAIIGGATSGSFTDRIIEQLKVPALVLVAIVAIFWYRKKRKTAKK